MKKQWEQCKRGVINNRWAGHYVTLNPKGVISISRRTHQAVGEAERFFLLYDRRSHTIGVNPAGPRDTEAFRANPHGRANGRIIRAFRLLQEFGIDIPKTVRFNHPEIDEDGVLVLDLRNARPLKN